MIMYSSIIRYKIVFDLCMSQVLFLMINRKRG